MIGGIFRGGSRRGGISLLILLVCVALVFGRSLSFDFVWDDWILMVGQDAYAAFDWRRILFSLANRVEYLPIRDLSYALDYALWGENPLGFHLTNLLLYLLNVACIHALTRRLTATLFPGERSLTEGKAADIALLTALLFAFHPIQSEAVSFVACRNVLLSGLFFFASCHFFLGHLAAADGEGRAAYAASLACCVLAIFSKATAVVLPGVLVLAAAFDARPWRNKLLRLAPFALVAVLAAILFEGVATQVGRINPDQVIIFGSRSVATRIAVAAQIPFFYLGKLVLPSGLSALYDTQFAAGLFDPRALLALLALVSAALLSVRLRRRRPDLVFALGWYLVALLPVLNFFATSPVVADRYAYLSVFPFAFVVSTSLFVALPKIPANAKRSAALVAVALLAIAAWQRIGVWRNDETLWSETIETSPRAWKAYYNLGARYFARGEREKAFRLFEQVAERSQNDGLLRFFRAQDALDRGDPRRAIDLLEGQPPLEVSPVRVPYLLGQAYERSGDLRKAVESYADALKKAGPSREEVVIDAGERLEVLRAKISAGLEGQRRAVEANPSDLNRRAELAIALDRAGLYDEALDQYAEISRRGGESWSLYYNMGNVFRKLERYEEAVASYERSLAMNPENARTYNNLGVALKRLGEYDRAIQAFQTATRLDPGFESAPFNLATLYFRMGDRENAIRAFDRVLQSFPDLQRRANPYLEALR